MEHQPDIVIIGSGIGGATVAAGLAPSGASIVILEAGDHLTDRPENRDQRAIFQRGHFRPRESWYEADGSAFNPGNYYNVGGNSKFYGAVLFRYRREDFEEMRHREGVSPAWPFPYEELEPWYGEAERLFQVRGAWETIPPSLPIPRPIRISRCRTSRRSRWCASDWRKTDFTRSACHWASISNAGLRRERRPGMPIPTAPMARWTARRRRSPPR